MQSRLRALQRGLSCFGLSLSEATLCEELRFIDEMLRWNARINLTSIVEPMAMIERHLVDSLFLLQWIESGTLLDVGSGAGLPGLPLAIAQKKLEIHSVETVGKKCAFQKHIVRSLGLVNVRVINARVENHESVSGYSHIVARAFAGIEDILKLTHHLVAKKTKIYLMRGSEVDEKPHIEAKATEYGLEIVHECAYELPLTGLKRHLIVLQRCF